jgi:hypothetical protein
LARKRYWYHEHRAWRNNDWYWFDPKVARYVVYVEGEIIPEAQYVESPEFSGDPIRIENGPENDAAVSYKLNDDSYEIEPGGTHLLTEDRKWVASS